MKRKLTMDDYFLSKEQLKRYKSGNLNYNETVYLSNKNVTDEILYIDTSKFKGCKIIIFNSSIETLRIKGFDNPDGTDIFIQNSKINSSIVNLNDDSKFEITSSKVSYLEVKANEILLDNLLLLNGTQIKVLADAKKQIMINKCHRDGYYTEVYDYYYLDLTATTMNLNIQDSVVYLSSNVKNTLNIDKSRIFFKFVESPELLIKQSIVSSELDNTLYFDQIIFSNVNELNNASFCADSIILSDKATVKGDSSLLKARTNVIIRNEAELKLTPIKNDNMVTKTVYLYPKAHFIANNTNHYNELSYTDRLKPQYLKEERQKLTKVLKLVSYKHNKPIKDLK